MRRLGLVFVASMGLVMNDIPEGNAADAKAAPLAGWLGVFPEMTNYGRTFTAPVVTADKDKKPVIYRQSVKYDWLGGDLRQFEVTLARDPAFKEKYAADTLRKEAKPPTEVKVGKKAGWLWELERQEGKFDAVVNRLVIPLAEDKALIVEDKSGRKEIMLDLAATLDLARMTAALDAPPRTDFKRNLDAFRVLKKGTPYSEIEAWVGHADKSDKNPNGVIVLEYKMPDGGRVLLTFAKLDSLTTARHEGKDGKQEDLVK